MTQKIVKYIESNGPTNPWRIAKDLGTTEEEVKKAVSGPLAWKPRGSLDGPGQNYICLAPKWAAVKILNRRENNTPTGVLMILDVEDDVRAGSEIIEGRVLAVYASRQEAILAHPDANNAAVVV